MKKKDFSTIALIVVFFVGVSVLLYPTVSDYWNSLHQSQAIATYADSVEKMDEQRSTINCWMCPALGL